MSVNQQNIVKMYRDKIHTAFIPKQWCLGVLLAFFAVLSACTKEGNTTYVVDTLEKDTSSMVYFISREGSLGDLGYVDAIYRGIVRGCNSIGAHYTLLEIPNDETTADLTVSLFFSSFRYAENKTLLVFVNDGLEPLFHKYEDLLAEVGEKAQVLLLETQDTSLPVNTVSFRQYGVCYQAGRIACRSFEREFSKVVIANANRTNEGITEMREGFTAGIADGIDRDDPYGDKPVSNIYFSDTTGGFDDADSAYQVAVKDFSGENVLLFPLCGGTTQGFLRYSRDANDFLILGVDTDMQNFSKALPFSVVKCTDKFVEDWIEKWGNGEKNPQHQVLGFDSGYTKIVVSNQYNEWLPREDVDDLYEVSLEKEKEYAKNK